MNLRSKLPSILIMLTIGWALSGATCINNYCQTHPEVCNPSPRPTPTAEPTSEPSPTEPPLPEATATPIPTPTSQPSPTHTPIPNDLEMCKRAIAMNAHFLVGGGGCHAWTPTGDGNIKCVLDTTWRPICDEDHMDNWNNPDICGKCSHDPDYNSPSGAQEWTVGGAEDRGPHPANSAQRIIVGKPGARVTITICPANPVIAAATGTVLPIRGDGCSRPASWNLPGN